MKKRCLVLATAVTVFAFVYSVFNPTKVALADELSDAVYDQLDLIDLNEIEELFESNGLTEYEFNTVLRRMLEGEFDGIADIGEYLKNVFLSELIKCLPTLIAVLSISFLYELIKGIRGGSGVNNTIRFGFSLIALLILLSEIALVFNSTKNAIKNITIFNEIMSPIMLTLTVASGGTSSAAVFSPLSVAFGQIVTVIYNAFCLPIILIAGILSLFSTVSDTFRLKGFSDFFYGLVKWIFGITTTLFGIVVTLNGIGSSFSDGISLKIAKYAISGSVPIIGGLVGGGVDLVCIGSVVIKNAIGIAGLLGIAYVIITPVFHCIALSLSLKLASAFSSVYTDGISSSLFSGTVKMLNHLIACVLTVGLMLFMSFFVMIVSASNIL